MGLKTGLDRCGKSRPHRDSISRPSTPQGIIVPTELPWPTLLQVIIIIIIIIIIHRLYTSQLQLQLQLQLHIRSKTSF
jgi:hypothetical protein